jgi:hypothetical protein
MFAVLLFLVAVYHYYAMLIHVSLTKLYILMLILLNYPQRMFRIRLTSLILPYCVPVPNQRTCAYTKYTGVNLYRYQIHWCELVQITNTLVWTCTENKYTGVNLHRSQIHWGELVQITNTLVWTCTENKYTGVNLYRTIVFVICTSSHHCICNLYKFTPLYL